MKPFHLVLLSLAGPVTSRMIEEPTADVKVEPGTARAWALATSAVAFERDNLRHDLLAGVAIDEPSVAATKKMLAADWHIASKADLMEHLEWLETKGHRVEFERAFREHMKQTAGDVERSLPKDIDPAERDRTWARWRNAPRATKLQGGVLAWDLSRYVALCRSGYGAGLITEEVAWKHIEPAAKKLREAYSCWEDLGEAYCIGRECWDPGSIGKTLVAFKKLKAAETSPWRSTPWNLDRDDPDGPEHPRAPEK